MDEIQRQTQAKAAEYEDFSAKIGLHAIKITGDERFTYNDAKTFAFGKSNFVFYLDSSIDVQTV